MDIKLTVLLVLVTLGLLVDHCLADLIWHNDEIPYSPTARCFRGHSYYTNHDTPNDTTIQYDEEAASLLDFKSQTACFYCVCSVDGNGAGCISRHLWFCNYLRYLRSDKATRDIYANMFQQDRPAYFRQLSYRIRRNMDNSIFDLIEKVSGDNEGQQGQGQGSQRACVPFVSQYTDCNEYNQCDGCTKCLCSMEGLWQCIPVKQCDPFEEDKVDDELFDAAIDKLDYEWKLRQQVKPATNRLVPPPRTKKAESDELLEEIKNYDPEAKLREMLRRSKRSAAKKSTNKKHSKRSTEKINKRPTRNSNNVNNNTIKFYSTVDDLNEDTLKHSNVSGTLPAQRVEMNILPDISRRSNPIDQGNKSLHIDFNQPKVFNHITDNKIDTADHENKIDLSHEKLSNIFSNHTQTNKDKELSKLVVNELKPGSEIIGDSHAPVTSNITFTSENDTLTAMAYIAGNLLNKLWSMEKDTSGSTLETDDLKQEKITELLDLFKEPLNLRQETFLKNALMQLSSAIDKNKDIKNVTICQTIEDATKLINNYHKSDEDGTQNVIIKQKPCKNASADESDKNNQLATIKAISKINHVLGLMKKFENVQKNLNVLKNESDVHSQDNFTKPISNKLIMDTMLTKDEVNSLNTFGSLLDKTTKLLMPKKNSKKITGLINDKNMFGNDQNFKNNFKKMFNIDLTNMTVTAKDKLVLDYITHINSNPSCALNENNHDKNTKSFRSVEGNILLNLSEFFKMKSFADLINLLEPEKAKKIIKPTTTKPAEATTAETRKIKSKNLSDDGQKKFASTKEKLKAHLKTIIEDLIELQDAKGIHSRSNIRIADALPCIYNIMNAGKDIFNKNNEKKTESSTIVDILNELRSDIKTSQTRRSDSIMKIRPKSAIVLERIVKSLGVKPKGKSRRFLSVSDLKPLEQVKRAMSKLRNVSSIYKNQALYTEVPAAERIVLLKALEQEVKNYVIALEGIKQSYKNLSKLPVKQYKELVSFIYSSASNITLNEKVVNKIEKVNSEKNINNKIKIKLAEKQRNRLSETQEADNNMIISRNQIINHLIRNRMQIYMRMKEARDFNVNIDMNYNIAKRVLFYLDSGNYNLAHELYKVLVMQKQEKLLDFPSNNDRLNDFTAPTPRNVDNSMHQNIVPDSPPPVQFEEPKILDNQMKWMSQDHLIKQLLNIKNMGI